MPLAHNRLHAINEMLSPQAARLGPFESRLAKIVRARPAATHALRFPQY
jgi:hypothetical protein